jgi:vacuolar-type H+-ATPase subunit H
VWYNKAFAAIIDSLTIMCYLMFTQVKITKLTNCEHQIQELQSVHQQELAEVDNRWRKCLEQQLEEAEARYKDKLSELSKEWHWERKV